MASSGAYFNTDKVIEIQENLHGAPERLKNGPGKRWQTRVEKSGLAKVTRTTEPLEGVAYGWTHSGVRVSMSFFELSRQRAIYFFVTVHSL
jgi:hypothetical protein